MKPKSNLLRAYILGVATGMGAAIAYLWGLSRREHQPEHWQIHFRLPLGEWPGEEGNDARDQKGSLARDD